MAPVDVTSNNSTHNSNDTSPVSNELHVQSINRVVGLPVVKSALGIATGIYTRVKEASPLVGSALTRGEHTVLLVAETAKPVVQKFEKPINYADSLLVQGLDKLEEKVPAIKKSPEELKNAGWGTYVALKDYGSSKIDGIKSFVTSQADKASATTVGQIVCRSLEKSLEMTEHALDNYLPPGEGEEPAEELEPVDNPTPDRIVRRITRVSDKMRRRIVRTDLVLMKRALGLLRPVKELTG